MAATTDSEKRRNWSFLVADGDDGRWKWRVSDAHGVEESKVTFATLKECTSDAMLNGYVVWKSEDERRRDLELGVAKVLRARSGA
jgi:hypothetical protein